MAPTYILGISAFYHDSAACLLADGDIVAAAQEERFSRRRHDSGFPRQAAAYCLNAVGAKISDLAYVAYYEKPLLKFERLLETYLEFAPRGLTSFLSAMPVWMKEKLFLRKLLQTELRRLAADREVPVPSLVFPEHHESHAASAFFPSPFSDAAILCIDGVGEWATTTGWLGSGAELKPLWEIDFPHSVGLLYSAFTYHTGFKVNSGEYKVMGLAPYGRPRYAQAIYDHLVDLRQDGSFRLNMDFFGYCTGLRMTNSRFDAVFGGPARKPESPLTQREMDLAASVQVVTEEIILRLARTLHNETAATSLCLAGGVALNCVANGRILREGPFEQIWIQPAAGDAGGAVGAALSAWHQLLEKPRCCNARDGMHGAYLGPEYDDQTIARELEALGGCGSLLDDRALIQSVVDALVAGKVVGWFQGRMEFGPRALGSRSIIGDARNPHMQSVMNLKIKHRESFRPLAPSVLRERVSDYFDLDCDSPYMLLVAGVAPSRRLSTSGQDESRWGIDLLNVPRSDIPAVTHIDYSARIQTVHRDTNPRYYDLIRAFEQRTGSAVLVNTSFNVRGEPIVCTPKDAYRCFMRTEMDVLAIGNHLLLKGEQQPTTADSDWRREFELD